MAPGMVVIVALYLSNIDRVSQNRIDNTRGHRISSAPSAFAQGFDRASKSALRYRFLDGIISLGAQKLIENEPNDYGLILINHQLIIFDPVTKRRLAPVDFAVPLACAQTVAHALSYQFAFEL